MPTPKWKPGTSGNPKGRPVAGLAWTEIARADGDARAMIKNLQRVALGQPMFRYEDKDGRHCVSGDQPPEGATNIRECFPSDADQLRAIQYFWDRVEPQSKQVDVTLRRGLDQQSQYDLQKFDNTALDRFIELTGELAEPDAEDAEVVDD